MQGQIKTPLGSKAQQIANQRNTMTKYFPVLHDPGHSNESFPMRERLLPALPNMQVRGIQVLLQKWCYMRA